MRTFIKKILIYINIIFALLLICSYLAGYVNPKNSWIIAFIGLSYPYLLIVNLVFLGYWIFKFKKAIFISLIAILIGWNNLSKYYQFPFKKNSKETPENSFKILSYNVRIFDLYYWTKKPKAREQIFNFIQTKSPDIICFQEFFTKKDSVFSEENIIKKLPNKYVHILYTKSNNYASYGIATYSIFPIVNKETIELENTTNSCIFSDIKIGNDTIRVYNNHLQSIRFDPENYNFLDSIDSKNDEERIKEIKDISNKIRYAFVKRAKQANIISDHIKTSPYPVIICGDFNDTPLSYTYHKIKDGLIDAFEVSGKGIGNTYTGEFPSSRIDYILHSPQLKSFNFEISKVALSDHYPILCEFYLE